MDIAKYIGLYLLKHNFAYLHGLGNLQIIKKPAQYDGEVLSAARYDVQLMPSGSIDDSMANFIATAEQTSISKASNEIRTFVENAKAELAEGKEVVIPGIGHFIQQNGVNRFVTDANMSYAPPSIPALKLSKRLEEEPSFRRSTPEEDAVNQGSSVNLQKMLLWVLGAAAVIGLVFFAIRFMNRPTEAGPVVPAPVDTVASPSTPVTTPAPTVVTDTSTVANPVPAAPATPAPAASGTRIVLRTYPSQAAAEKRQRQLRMTPLGETVSVVAQDSTHYMVVVPYTDALADSSRVLDSLSRVYGNRARLIP